MSSGHAVGVDAGGSNVVAAIARDGAVRSLRFEGGANVNAGGVAGAARAIVEAVRAVLGSDPLGRLYVGAAGAGRKDASAALEAALRAAFPQAGRIVVEDDARVALRSAIADGPGAAIVAGTGSVAYAENGTTRVRAGGDGYLIGDDGSGYAIGRAAIVQYARTFDGRAQPDETTALVATAFDAGDRDALFAAIYAQAPPVAKIASLAPGVIALAGEGNRASTKIVQAAAQELGSLVRHVVRAAALGDASPEIALAGGLLRENSLLSFLLETRIVNETPGAAVVRSREEPAVAALRFAQALA